MSGDGGAVPVAFVTPAADVGGAERYLFLLLEHLAPGWVDGVVALAEGETARRARDAGHRVAVVPAGRRAGALAGAVRLRRLLAASRARVVHANGVKSAFVAVPAAHGLGVPVIWVKHDFSGDGLPARALGARCRMVVGVSAAVVETFAGSRADVRVVPNGIAVPRVDAAAGRARLLEALAAPPDAEVVLAVARLEEGKGVLDLVEQLPRLRAARPAVRLALAGPPSRFEPDVPDRLRARARALGVADAVTLLGARDDAAELMAGADVVAVPTRPYAGRGTGEGFGLVAAESLAVGTPVVAAGHGGLPEVVGDAGLLVPPGDPAAGADALARVLSDAALRERLVLAGRERARRFDPAAVASAMQALYREAAAGR
jgi:glycosyltransferase involved in cell wall biosynthesis